MLIPVNCYKKNLLGIKDNFARKIIVKTIKPKKLFSLSGNKSPLEMRNGSNEMGDVPRTSVEPVQ